MLVSDKQWLSRVRGLLQRHCSHFIKGRIELINAKVAIVASRIKIQSNKTNANVNRKLFNAKVSSMH